MPRTVIEAPPDKVQAYLEARERKARASGRKLQLYFDDPVAFVNDCVTFPANEGLAVYQKEVMEALVQFNRASPVAPHGTGKSTLAALLVLWFSITRDGAGADWKCITTASAWRQLEFYLWPEIRKWARQLRWDRIGREPFKRDELLALNLKLPNGSATAVASNNVASIEGAHADSIFWIFDESKAIMDETFDAAEGALSGAGVNGREGFALALSTPGDPVGRFFDIHDGPSTNVAGRGCKKGLEQWWTRHITLDEAVAAGRINPDWAKDRAVLWGADSQMYYNRVLGEFHASEIDSIIPLSWVEAAVERWHESRRLHAATPALDRIGVDVAGEGADRTVLAFIHGHRVSELQYFLHAEAPETQRRVIDNLNAHPSAVAIVDADGLGVSIFQNIKEQVGNRVQPFHAAGATSWRDSSKELEFINCRAAAWWSLREMLDPSKEPTLELPDDDQLVSELSNPKWKESGRGKIQVESKDDIRKRLSGRSTDAADSVIMGLFVQRKKRRRRMGSMGFGSAA